MIAMVLARDLQRQPCEHHLGPREANDPDRIGKHPAVLGSAVVGRADEQRGQLPVAFVMLRPGAIGTLNDATLTGWCRENMAVYKVPIVRIVDALPLTATGKVRKQDLAPLAEQL